MQLETVKEITIMIQIQIQKRIKTCLACHRCQIQNRMEKLKMTLILTQQAQAITMKKQLSSVTSVTPVVLHQHSRTTYQEILVIVR